MLLIFAIVLAFAGVLFWLFRTPAIERYLEKDVSALHEVDQKKGILTEEDIADFPQLYRDYIRFTKAVGKPLINNFRCSFEGDFALKIGSPYIQVKTVQYNSANRALRLFYLNTRIMGMPMYGRDSYADGNGRMWGRLCNLWMIFNDVVLLCPAVLVNLKQRLTWKELDDNKLSVSVENTGIRVSAELHLDENHNITNFITHDRFCDNPDKGKDQARYVRAKWSTPLSGEWQEVDGRMIPKRGRAIWHLSEPGFCYADFRICSFTVNT